MIDEDSGEPVPCPICGALDGCKHWVGTVDKSFSEIFGPLDDAFQKIAAAKDTQEDWDGDFYVLLRSIMDFLESHMSVEYEIGISPGGPGYTSAETAYYSEEVANVVDQVANEFTKPT